MTADQQSLDAAEAFGLLGAIAAVVASAGGEHQSEAIAVASLLKGAHDAIVHKGRSLQDVLLAVRGCARSCEPDAPTRIDTPRARRREE